MSTLTKVSEKDLPQLYCMKMKICYDVCFIDVSGVTLMRPLRILLTIVFLGNRTFSQKSPEGACTFLHYLNSPVSNSSRPLNGSTENSFRQC